VGVATREVIRLDIQQVIRVAPRVIALARVGRGETTSERFRAAPSS
jgi:hypothetical protein